MIFNMVGGGSGGSGEAFAAISVTYPTGSICTCSKGSKVLRAKDTSGSFLFGVTEGGTWTITATDGANAATKTVDVEQNGVYSIEVSYAIELYDSSKGGVITTYSGGFAATGLAKSSPTTVIKSETPSVTYNSNNMYISEPGASSTEKGGIVVTKNKIDLTGKKTIKLTHTAFSRRDTDDSRINIAVWSAIGNAQNVNRVAMAALSASEAQSGTITLSINLSGSYYVGIGLCSYGTTQTTLTVTKFWIE